MFELDIRTLLVVTALVSIGSSAALISLWRSQSKRNGAGFWAAGMSCIAVASILISGRGSINDFFSLVVANSLYVIGFLLILRGIRIFADRPPLVLFDFGFPPITAILFYYFNYVEENINIRIAVLSIAFMFTCFAIVITLLREKNAAWRSSGFPVATIFGLFGIFHGIRGVISLLSPFNASLVHSSFSTSLVLLGGIFILAASAITLTMLTYAVLESELRIFSLAVNQSASSIVITDSNGIINYVNPTCIDKTGYLQQELIGESPKMLDSGETTEAEYAAIWETLSTGKTWRGELHNRKKNGQLFWEISSIAPVKKKNGQITHYVSMKEDITALKHAEKRILHMANHDGLTGLPTRRLSMDRLLNSISNAKRNNTMVAVLFIDIDGFKAVNDTFGHDAGDHLLKETATRICSCVREVDTVARFGGDEFLVMLTNIPDKNSVISISEKLIEAVAIPYEFHNGDLNVSASIGIALYPNDSADPMELVNLADQSMYRIKRQGKNNYAFSEK